MIDLKNPFHIYSSCSNSNRNTEKLQTKLDRKLVFVMSYREIIQQFPLIGVIWWIPQSYLQSNLWLLRTIGRAHLLLLLFFFNSRYSEVILCLSQDGLSISDEYCKRAKLSQGWGGEDGKGIKVTGTELHWRSACDKYLKTLCFLLMVH